MTCLKADPDHVPSSALAFAIAALLRFLTPFDTKKQSQAGIFNGKMDPNCHVNGETGLQWEYATGLGVELEVKLV